MEPLVGSNGTLKRLSNIVNLTEWKGQFTYTHKDTGSLVGTIVVNAHLRSDIHPFRELPHVPPIRYSIIFPAMEDSYATATAAGTASYTDDSDPPSTTTWTWTGSTLIDSIKNQTELSLMIIGFVDFAAHKFRMDLLAANTDPLLESIDYSDGGHDEQGLYFQTVLELYDQFPWKLILDMNNNWGIVAGERNAVTCCSHNPLNTEGTPDIKHKLIWQTIPATWAPDTTSAQ